MFEKIVLVDLSELVSTEKRTSPKCKVSGWPGVSGTVASGRVNAKILEIRKKENLVQKSVSK